MKSSKSQTPNSNLQTTGATAAEFGIWNLEFGISIFQSATKFLLAAVSLTALLHPDSSWACAACYGASDSPMAKGMNWGIFSLLAVVVCVLSTFATFFVFLAKKSAATYADAAAQPSLESTDKL